jgi:hypothetical protein
MSCTAVYRFFRSCKEEVEKGHPYVACVVAAAAASESVKKVNVAVVVSMGNADTKLHFRKAVIQLTTRCPFRYAKLRFPTKRFRAFIFDRISDNLMS